MNGTAPTELAVLLKAAEFAAARHRDQRRKGDASPYINHPLGVARLLNELGGIEDVATLAGAILHDTVEDTRTSPEEIEEEFGAEIRRIVDEVTDDKSRPSVERKRAQVEHARVMSIPGRLVKLADKLHNLRDLGTTPPQGWDLARIRGYFCWAHEVVEAVGDVNPALQSALAEVFASEFEFDGQSYRAVPADPDERRAMLDSYYELMAARSD